MKNNLKERPIGTVKLWDTHEMGSPVLTEAMVNYTHGSNTPVTWEPNDRFTSKLTYSHWERGRSRTTFWFQDESGRHWPFSAGSVHRLLTGLQVEGTFEAVKRGDSYHLVYVDE